ncbi:hypothetical protein, partial [Amycolatopsis sp. lyj-108]|uniref:hypothetical protein n=1 Tax=Amycolatopsis sp. lyj-108 TaxID=2789286 RepID=UPI00397883C4
MIAVLLVSVGTVPSTTTTVVLAPPPPASVVVVEPPTTVTRAPAVQDLTSCQRLLAEGYSFEYAFSAWVNAGRPLSRDADRDGYPSPRRRCLRRTEVLVRGKAKVAWSVPGGVSGDSGSKPH